MSDTKIYNSKYKDQNSITLESSLIRVQIMPHIGSNMCSFFYKPKNLELLIQSLYDKKNKKYKVEPYGGDLTRGEASGFDEMFPTVLGCYYESFPWEGIRIPDFGEVWSTPWEYEVEKNKLTMKVHGVRFPYQLEKTVYFTEDNILRIDYILTNFSNFNFDFLWMAHTNFILEENSEIIFPESVNSIIITANPSGRLGRYGDEHSWPSFISSDCKNIILNKVRSKMEKDWAKYYVKGKMPEGWCALKYSKSNLILALSFPVEKVPYLAVLPNEGGFGDDAFSILVEPCTSSFDRLDMARVRGEYSSISPKSNYSWYLNLTVSEDVTLKSIHKNGYIIQPES